MTVGAIPSALRTQMRNTRDSISIAASACLVAGQRLWAVLVEMDRLLDCMLRFVISDETADTTMTVIRATVGGSVLQVGVPLSRLLLGNRWLTIGIVTAYIIAISTVMFSILSMASADFARSRGPRYRTLRCRRGGTL